MQMERERERETETKNMDCQQKGNMELTIRGQMEKGSIHFRIFQHANGEREKAWAHE